MIRPYFLEQMMKLIQSSFHIYNEEKGLMRRYGTRKIETDFFTENSELLRSRYARQGEE